jgi:hypothetical protein
MSMSGSSGPLFRTMTDADWRRSIGRMRARSNGLAVQLRAKLSAAVAGTAQQKTGFEESGKPAAGRVLSPAARKSAGGDALAECPRAAGGHCHDGQSTDAQANSCAVGSATAGRDRRNFWESAPAHSQVGGVKPQPCDPEIGASAPAQFPPLCTTSSAWFRGVRNRTGRHGPEASEPVNARTQRKSSSTGDRGESAALI